MRRILLLLVAALLLALSAAPAALAQADRDCADFGSQAEAQTYFQANGGGPSNNVDNNDGQACEDFGYGADAGASGDATGGDSLPFTGPASTLLPAGTALVLGGLVLIGATRHRACHARR